MLPALPDLPYAATLGLQRVGDSDPPTLIMPYRDALIGSPARLHGGAVAGLLEIAAMTALHAALGGAPVQAKPISVTVDYLRGGAMVDSYARAEIVKLGRRVASVRARAWQDDAAKPIAVAQMNILIERG